MEDLAKRLGPYLGRPVLDRTELKGSYDFRVPYASDDPHPDVVSVILECVRELGLKLEASRGPIKTLVIDGAESPQKIRAPALRPPGLHCRASLRLAGMRSRRRASIAEIGV